ncbi:iron complex transport system substrate-binding protein [Methanococcus maripaludis]|uniref:Iron complex transport system substrate-binding protein n=1 Tax=Methanococcus maripaludis TaxID=39152 RepID=A0A7J9NJ63_METMI|nr:ABC transporter substrate-binding protein [Methanococcus maripaludis]MBA2840966.1 iron complex transport system substrate-binding protein [Methanococcus maripaludis]
MKKIMALLMLAMIALMPSACAQDIGDVNGDDSISIADVVYLFKHRDVGLDVGDLNCDNSVNVVDVVYLFKNYDTFRDPVVFAENFEMDPNWDEGYCYIVDSQENKYVLLQAGATDPQIEGATVLDVPSTSIVTMTNAPIVATADILNVDYCYESIKGMPNTYTKYSDELLQRYDDGLIVHTGSISEMDYEAVASIDPDIVFLSYRVQQDAMEEKLDELEILSCRCHVYLEPTFMGRTEWIKFGAAFWGIENSDTIEDYFQETWQKRNELLRTTANVDDYPAVVSFSWSSSTDMATIYGAQQFYNKMANEFGGEFIFNDVPGTSTVRLDKETFYERAQTADVCILRSYTDVITKEDLLAVNPDFADFESFKNGRFYVTHSDSYIDETKDPIGFMDDNARMIHPELFSNGDSNLKYHYKIQ